MSAIPSGQSKIGRIYKKDLFPGSEREVKGGIRVDREERSGRRNRSVQDRGQRRETTERTERGNAGDNGE